jgi:hypothetical protein
MGRLITKELQDLLQGLLHDQELTKLWWSTPNVSFGGISPEVAWECSPDLVLGYLRKHSGIHD